MSIINYIPLFIQGISITIAAWFIAGTLSMIIGIIAGFASCNYLRMNKLQYGIKLYTFITKGVPAYVQILIAYFVLPTLFHVNVSGFIAATGALALCSSGYMTEIIRAGINALPQGQWDACFVLGYSLPTAIRRVMLPQLIRSIIPTLVGELEQLLKSTTLLATIGVTEVTRVGINIISRELNPLPIYIVIALIYLLFSALLHVAMIYTQQKVQYDYR